MPEEGITLAFTNEASNRRRIRLERRDAGGWTMHDEEYDGDKWRPVGREIVADAELEIGTGATDVVDVITAAGAAETITGPEAADR
ncbi:hypothetical protein HZS55_15800 [Halosimplex rubrum]|uniref:Uncharacterized protein n=1 Tax=Halosimplex rubrum TaxID=869889 RepID=A0A7D5P455_9EURY|nr:hypothetical protein [Halosimplex rubrum]QLH78661.1 hypothetical protein HZS55_15800 [Halosimplex rubrum]